jgi:hypothetical protein
MHRRYLLADGDSNHTRRDDERRSSFARAHVAADVPMSVVDLSWRMVEPGCGMQQVERTSEVERLSSLLEHPEQQLSICTITGPGGVGKSHLLRHVLERVPPAERRYLHLFADASRPENRRELGAALSQLFPHGLRPPAKSDHDYFVRLRKTLAAHRALVDDVANELRNKSAEVREVVTSLLKLGREVNALVPQTKKHLDLTGLPKDPKEVERVLRDVESVVTGVRAFAERSAFMKLFPGPALQDRVKRDFHGALADAVRADLSAALASYEAGDAATPRAERIPRTDRLLVVLDDYEALSPVLDDFVRGALVPRLADAPFKTVLIILCRDELDAVDPSWLQHCDRFLVERIRVKPFTELEALELMQASGIPADRAATIHRESGGFPFLVGLAIEEHSEESAGVAMYLRKFFDRTSRWMSENQRRWFTGACYLDAVNEDTLARMFPNESTTAIQDWFEREPSIRDPHGAVFVVRPVIRANVLRYQEMRAPSQHRELTSRARPPAHGANEKTR